MERSDYLNLTARYKNGENVKVLCDGIEYYPCRYILEPIKGGGWSHIAHLKDTKARSSYREAPLANLTEVE
jgi:hypothetical protein